MHHVLLGQSWILNLLFQVVSSMVIQSLVKTFHLSHYIPCLVTITPTPVGSGE